MRRVAAIFGFFLILSVAGKAATPSDSADAQHLHVQLVFPQTQLSAGVLNRAGLYFKLEQGWHVYWQNAGDSGEPPHIKWELPAGMTAGSLEFPAPTRLPLGPLMDFGYEKEVLFPMTLAVNRDAKPGPAVLHAKVDWLVCREVCIPGKADLQENVQVASGGVDAGPVRSGNQALWNRLAQTLPVSLPISDKAFFQPTANGFRLAVETGKRETQAAFFPQTENLLDNPASQNVISTPKGLILDLKKDVNLGSNPPQLKGVVELAGGRNYDVEATPGTVVIPAQAPASWMLLRITGLAFLGGLLLNLMPCVFPVLFLKGLALVQSSGEERHTLRAHGLVYTSGILVSFWVLVGALLVLRAAGATLGWGFQFQSPIFLALMAGLLFFLGLSLAGQFEIGLTLTSAGGSLAAKQGYAGSFFTGVLAVVVATPCTAPFMSVAIGYALAQPAVVTFAVFTALGCGLAGPYLALTFQPAWTRLLPKPGAWMEILRQAISVPIFATVIWLAWVIAGAYGATALAALLGCFLLLAIAGWFMGRWPAQRWSSGVAAALVFLVIGLSIYEQRLAGETEPVTSSSSASGSATATDSSANTWRSWSADEVQRALASGKPVFVDFTASWCLSCQVNERVALRRPEVMQAFQSKNVVLLKADWTREDPAITQALTDLGRSGVPVYALYTPGQDTPQLLPQVLTPVIVTGALAALPQAQTARSE